MQLSSRSFYVKLGPETLDGVRFYLPPYVCLLECKCLGIQRGWFAEGHHVHSCNFMLRAAHSPNVLRHVAVTQRLTATKLLCIASQRIACLIMCGC